ncbi:hypothetical protein LA345_23440 [Burkholderia vietnamiensis]|nr:hypothetical protein [Burkholderia vietnamiensis]
MFGYISLIQSVLLLCGILAGGYVVSLMFGYSLREMIFDAIGWLISKLPESKSSKSAMKSRTR